MADARQMNDAQSIQIVSALIFAVVLIVAG
jgi:hypothetical protein